MVGARPTRAATLVIKFLPGKLEKALCCQRGSETALIGQARARSGREKARCGFGVHARGVSASPAGRIRGARDVFWQEARRVNRIDIFKKVRALSRECASSAGNDRSTTARDPVTNLDRNFGVL